MYFSNIFLKKLGFPFFQNPCYEDILGCAEPPSFNQSSKNIFSGFAAGYNWLSFIHFEIGGKPGFYEAFDFINFGSVLLEQGSGIRKIKAALYGEWS